jgi:hypothetical protein
MSPFMVLFVANRREDAATILAFIGLLPCVGSHVHHQVSFLGEGTSAPRQTTLEHLQARVNSLQMQVQAVAPSEALRAPGVCARDK